MKVQFKPYVRDLIKKSFNKSPFAKVDDWYYSTELLKINYFEVKDSILNDEDEDEDEDLGLDVDIYFIISPSQVKDCKIPQKHVEPYHEGLDDSLFEWGE